MPTVDLNSPRPRPHGIWLCLTLALGCRSDGPTDSADVEPSVGARTTAGATAGATDGGEIVAISGPGGVQSPALPAGAFLGKGGRLTVGQPLHTPRGTLAELRLPGGVRVRMNEDTAITLPGDDATARLVLTRGELVVLTEPEATAGLSIAAGDEVLTITRGEAQIRHAGSVRRFAVINGAAELQAPSRSLSLGAGESIEAPLPEERPRRPELSLAPLQQTRWSRTFEAASRLADQAPEGVGSLTARRPGRQSERQRLKLTNQKVDVGITGRIAHTEIEQTFFNDRAAVLEGIYRFPLPGDGSVSGLSLLVGNRWMEGEIVEKTRARQIFRSIVDATVPRDPALLEWERGNLFKLRVFPIPGRGQRSVRLAYTQVLPVTGRTLRYRFPMAGSGAGGTEIEQFSFTVTVDGQPLEAAQMADIETHMLDFERRIEDDRVHLTAQREHFVPTADIGVDIPMPPTEARVHTETHLDRDGQAYFMVSMRPELELPRPEGPTSFAFVLDRSHSTSRELWTVARGVVEALASSMEPDDRFAVLACDTACDEAPGGLLSPSADDLDEVRRFFDAQDLAGASDVGGMLVSAAEALERGGAPGERVVVYLGDGTPSSGEMAAAHLARHVAEPLRDTRVMAVALGARSDLTTLGAIVTQTGGDIVRADPRDDRQALVRELRLRARVPMATDLELDTPDGMIAVRRRGTAGLRPGDDLVLVGKLSRPVHDEIVVRAQGPSGPVEARFHVDLEARRDSPVQHRHLPRTWAQAEIAHLTQTRGFEARDQVVALSKHYTVMSRHTSLLVLENDAMYREFNVVRAARRTDTWGGKLAESDKEDANAQAEAADGSREQRKAELEPLEEEELPRDPTEFEAGLGRNRGSRPTASAPAVPPTTDRSEPLRGAAGADSKPDLKDTGHDESRARDNFDPAPEPKSGAEPEPEPAADPVLPDLGLEDDDADRALGDEGGHEPPRKPSRKRKRRSHKPLGDPLSPSSEPSGGWSSPPPPAGGTSSGRRRGGGWTRPAPQLKSRPATGARPRTLARIEQLRRAVDADPTQRGPHGVLVRAALRAHHPQSLEFARAWAEVDPDHAPALMSLADAMAVDGDPMALRAYESALEVRPFVPRPHTELALAFERKGDLRRACSHRRAVVSIEPSRAEHHVELARCLAREGRRPDAQRAIDDGNRRATQNPAAMTDAQAELDRGAAPPASVALHAAPHVRAILTWSGEEDLDLSIIDAKGRRLSGMRPQGKVRVRESAGREELSFKRVGKSIFIEVTRPTPSRAPEGARGSLRAELTLVTRDGTRRFPVSIQEGTVRVATVLWTR